MKAIVKYISAFLIVFQALSLMGQSNFDTANKLYNQGLYDSSLIVYNNILNSGVHSAELYYNMANASFKNNDIPSAILYYEKAKKLSPNDEDILYNLSICNSMIVDKIEKVPQMFYKQWWNYFYEMFNADSWAIISLVFWILFLGSIGFYILSRTRVIKKLSFYSSVVLFIAVLGTTGLASQKYYYIQENKEAIIFTPTITVKSSPTANSVDLFVIHEGTKVLIIDTVNGWNKIKIQDGSIGWLASDSMKLI